MNWRQKSSNSMNEIKNNEYVVLHFCSLSTKTSTNNNSTLIIKFKHIAVMKNDKHANPLCKISVEQR